jgi:hypothetical protein
LSEDFSSSDHLQLQIENEQKALELKQLTERNIQLIENEKKYKLMEIQYKAMEIEHKAELEKHN